MSDCAPKLVCIAAAGGTQVFRVDEDALIERNSLLILRPGADPEFVPISGTGTAEPLPSAKSARRLAPKKPQKAEKPAVDKAPRTVHRAAHAYIFDIPPTHAQHWDLPGSPDADWYKNPVCQRWRKKIPYLLLPPRGRWDLYRAPLFGNLRYETIILLDCLVDRWTAATFMTVPYTNLTGDFLAKTNGPPKFQSGGELHKGLSIYLAAHRQVKKLIDVGLLARGVGRRVAPSRAGDKFIQDYRNNFGGQNTSVTSVKRAARERFYEVAEKAISQWKNKGASA